MKDKLKMYYSIVGFLIISILILGILIMLSIKESNAAIMPIINYENQVNLDDPDDTADTIDAVDQIPKSAQDFYAQTGDNKIWIYDLVDQVGKGGNVDNKEMGTIPLDDREREIMLKKSENTSYEVSGPVTTTETWATTPGWYNRYGNNRQFVLNPQTVTTEELKRAAAAGEPYQYHIRNIGVIINPETKQLQSVDLTVTMLELDASFYDGTIKANPIDDNIAEETSYGLGSTQAFAFSEENFGTAAGDTENTRVFSYYSNQIEYATMQYDFTYAGTDVIADGETTLIYGDFDNTNTLSFNYSDIQYLLLNQCKGVNNQADQNLKITTANVNNQPQCDDFSPEINVEQETVKNFSLRFSDTYYPNKAPRFDERMNIYKSDDNQVISIGDFWSANSNGGSGDALLNGVVNSETNPEGLDWWNTGQEAIIEVATNNASYQMTQSYQIDFMNDNLRAREAGLITPTSSSSGRSNWISFETAPYSLTSFNKYINDNGVNDGTDGSVDDITNNAGFADNGGQQGETLRYSLAQQVFGITPLKAGLTISDTLPAELAKNATNLKVTEIPTSLYLNIQDYCSEKDEQTGEQNLKKINCPYFNYNLEEIGEGGIVWTEGTDYEDVSDLENGVFAIKTKKEINATSTLVIQFDTKVENLATENDLSIINTAEVICAADDENCLDEKDETDIDKGVISLDSEKRITQVEGNNNDKLAENEKFNYEIAVRNPSSETTDFSGNAGISTSAASDVQITDGVDNLLPNGLRAVEGSIKVIGTVPVFEMVESIDPETNEPINEIVKTFETRELIPGKEYVNDSDITNGIIDITVNSIAVDGEVVVSFEVVVEEVEDIDTFVNIATITPGEENLCIDDAKNVIECVPAYPKNEDEPEYPEIVGAKSVEDQNNDGAASLGEELYYTVEATNKSLDVAATEVHIYDDLSANGLEAFDFATITDITVIATGGRELIKDTDYRDNSDLVAGLIDLTIKEILPEETVKISFTIKLKDDYQLDGAQLENTAVIDTPYCTDDEKTEDDECNPTTIIEGGLSDVQIIKTNADLGEQSTSKLKRGNDVITQVQQLNLKSIPADGIVEMGEYVNYNLEISHTKNSSEVAKSVVIIDELPEELDSSTIRKFQITKDGKELVIGTDYTYDLTDNIIEVSLVDNLKLGEIVNISFDIAAATNYNNNTNAIMINNAVVKSENDNDDSNNQSEVENNKSVPNLIIEKTNDVENENVVPGTPINYTIKVTNNGNVSAYDIIINDKVPEVFETPVEDLTVDKEEGVKEVGQLERGEIKYEVDEIKPNETITINFKAILKSDIKNETNVNNEATIDGSVCEEGFIFNIGNNGSDTSVCKDEVITELVYPNVSIEKELVDESMLPKEIASIGETLTYTLTVENSGDGRATNVEVLDNYSTSLDEFTLIKIEDSKGNKITPLVNELINNEQKFVFEEIPAGESYIITYQQIVLNNDEPLENIATVIEPLNPECFPEPKKCEDSEVIEGGEAKIQAQKVLYETYTSDGLDNDLKQNGKLEKEKKYTYAIRVQNTGNDNALDVKISDQIPTAYQQRIEEITVGLTDVNGSYYELNEGVDYTLNQNNNFDEGLIDITAKIVPAQSELVLSFEVELADDLNNYIGTEVENTALIDSPDCQDDTATKDIDECNPTTINELPSPDIIIEKNVLDENGDSIAKRKEKLTYEIKVTNQGEGLSTNFTVSDPLTAAELEGSTPTNIKVKDSENQELKEDKEYKIKTTNTGLELEFINDYSLNTNQFVLISFEINVNSDYGGEIDNLITNQAEVIDEKIPNCTTCKADAEILKGDSYPQIEKEVGNDYGVKGIGQNDGLIQANEEFEFIINVRNAGTAVATEVQIVDDISEIVGLTGQIINVEVSKGEYEDASDLAKGKLDITIKEIKPNLTEEIQIIVRVKANSDLTAITSILNEAIIASDDDGICQQIESSEKSLPRGIETPCKDTAEGLPGNPVPQIEKVLSEKSNNTEEVASLNEELIYKVSITNGGVVSSIGAILQDQLPKSLELIEIVSVIDRETGEEVAYSDNSSENMIEIIFDEIRAEQIIDVEYKTKVITVTEEPIINTAQIDFPETPNNPTSEEEIESGVGHLKIEKTLDEIEEDDYVAVGDTIIYNVKVLNDGTNPVSTSEFTDQLPNELELIELLSVESNTGETVQYVDFSEGNTLNLKFEEIDVKEIIEIKYSVKVKDNKAKTIENTAEIIDPANPKCEPKPIDCEDTEIIYPEMGNVTIEKDLVEDKGVNGSGVNDGIAQLGEELIYQLKIRNDGAAMSRDVSLIDQLPKSLTGNVLLEVSSENQDLQYTGGLTNNKLELVFAEIKVGEEIIVKYSAIVNDTEETIENIATISDPTNPECFPNPNKCKDTTIIPPGQTNINIVKELTNDAGIKDTGVNDGVAQLDEELTYTLTATNKGNEYGYDVILIDDLPNELTLIELQKVVDSETGEIVEYTDETKDNNVKIKIPTFKPKQSISLVIKVKVNTIESKEIINIAKVKDPANPDCLPEATQCQSETVIPTESAIIGINKSITDESEENDKIAQLNEKLTYTLEVTNSGIVSASNVIIQDELPSQLEFIKIESVIDSKTGDDIEYEDKTKDNNLELVLDLIKAGQIIEISYTTRVINNSSEEIINTATVFDPMNPECLPVPKACKDSEEIIPGNPIITANKSMLTKDGEQILPGVKLQPNEMYQYKIDVLNSGGDTAYNTEVIDPMPEAINLPLTEDDINIISSMRGELTSEEYHVSDKQNLETGQVGVIIDEIAIKETVSVVINIKIANDLNGYVGETIENIATINSPYCIDEPITDFDDCHPTTIEEIGDIDLAIKKSNYDASGDGKIEAGEIVTYKLEVTNSVGSIPAINTEIVDLLSAAELDSKTITNIKVTKDDQLIDFEVLEPLTIKIKEPINGGEKVIVSFDIKTKEDFAGETDGEITNTATVKEESAREENLDNNSADSEIEKITPSINLNKSILLDSENELIEPGEEFTYILNITNNSEAKATDIKVVDDLSTIGAIEEISAIHISGSTNYEDKSSLEKKYIEVIIPEIAAGKTVTVKIEVVAQSEINSDASIINQAIIEADECLLEGAICEDEEKTEVGRVDLKAEKRVKDENNDKLAADNEYLTYTIEVENKGNIRATDVLIKDELKALELTEDTVRNLQVNGEAVSGNITEGLKINIKPDEKVLISFEVKASGVQKEVAIYNEAEIINPADPDNPLFPNATINPKIPEASASEEECTSEKCEEQVAEKGMIKAIRTILKTGNGIVLYMILIVFGMLLIILLRIKSKR